MYEKEIIMKFMLSNFLHRIYMDAMPIEYNSSYIEIFTIFLIVEIIAAVIMSIMAICIIVKEKREKIIVVEEEGMAICIIIKEKRKKILVVEEENKTFVKKPIYWLIFGAGCCFILILSYLALKERRNHFIYDPTLRFFWDIAFVPLGFFLLNAGILRFIISHLKKDISVNDVIVQILIVLGIILIVLGSIHHINFGHIIHVDPSYYLQQDAVSY